MITRHALNVRGLDIPYFDIRGRGDGTRLTVVAGVHGTEYTSIAAVREFVRDLDPDQVSGRIVAVPVVNVPAFWARSPFVVPQDGKNLNRHFPGDPDGTFTEALAHRVFSTFVLTVTARTGADPAYALRVAADAGPTRPDASWHPDDA